MNEYLIRFNKTRGQPGRGSKDHVWRVFENGREYLAKHVKITVPIEDRATGEDYNFYCKGYMTVDKESSTVIISSEKS
jgi:hypothetical protein